MKLPVDNFFNERDDILSFGKETRDIALEHVSNFDTVIDIGAHVGISVLHWAEFFKNIHAYEPMLDHYNCLNENTKHLPNVSRYNYAISNENKILKGAYRTSKNSGSFQLIDENYKQPKKKSPRKLYDVKSYKLDEFVFDCVDLLKVDVEGWEYEVLLGAKETIKKHNPVLLIEFTGGNSKKSLHKYNVNDYYKLIDELGYKPVASAVDDTIYIKR